MWCVRSSFTTGARRWLPPGAGAGGHGALDTLAACGSGVPVECAETTRQRRTLWDPPARAIRNELLTHHTSSPLALGIFAYNGRVEWITGLVLAGGTFIGALIGVRLQVLKGQKWVRGVLTATIVVFAIRLLVAG